MKFIEIPSQCNSFEYANTDKITKVFTQKQMTRVNLCDSSYIITPLSKEDVMELIHE